MSNFPKALLMATFVLATAATAPAFAESGLGDHEGAPTNESVIASHLEPGGYRANAAADYGMATPARKLGKQKTPERVSDDRNQDYAW
jgi:hypothetical protein